jgi:hypothetical protein
MLGRLGVDPHRPSHTRPQHWESGPEQDSREERLTPRVNSGTTSPGWASSS